MATIEATAFRLVATATAVEGFAFFLKKIEKKDEN